MNTTVKAYVALALVCFFWGTTFIAARIGVTEFPALFFMASRNFIAGILLLIIVCIREKGFKWNWKDIRMQIIPGLLMIALGTGVVGWSVQFIPSGLAALIYCTVPIFTVAINAAFLKSEKVNGWILAGMLVGIGGVLLIFKDNLEYVRRPESLLGMIVALSSCVFWCFGGLYTKLFVAKTDSFFNASIQMMSGGIGLFVLSLFNEDWYAMPTISTNSLLALLYLIIFGSIVAFGSYLYAFAHLPAGLVSIYAYVNPLVALTLGFLILNEKISWITALSFLVTISGVFLVNFGYRIQKEKLKEVTT